MSDSVDSFGNIEPFQSADRVNPSQQSDKDRQRFAKALKEKMEEEQEKRRKKKKQDEFISGQSEQDGRPPDKHDSDNDKVSDNEESEEEKDKQPLDGESGIDIKA